MVRRTATKPARRPHKEARTRRTEPGPMLGTPEPLTRSHTHGNVKIDDNLTARD